MKINSEGIRGEELLESPRKRILFLGDSIVFDSGVPLSKTFVYQFEKMLNSGKSDRSQYDIEVLNFGTTDAGIDQYFLKLKFHGLKLDPDYVFLGFYLNDAVDPQGYLGTENMDIVERLLDSRILVHFASARLFKKLYRSIKYTTKIEMRNRFRWVKRYRTGSFIYDDEEFKKVVSEADQD